jgi:CelD/BcsL family acetyltransferase involved in cellulose biosynthesis
MARATFPVAVPSFVPATGARPMAAPASSGAAASSWDQPWTIATVEDAAGLGALREEWNELLEASPADGLFLTWEWHSSWWRHLAADSRLSVLAVRRGSRLVALAPFAHHRGGGRLRIGASRLKPLGNGPVGSDYLDLVARAGEEIRALRVVAGELERRRTIVELPQLLRRSSGAELLARLLEQRGWRSLERVTHLCPYADLRDHTWESFLQSLGARHRENVRRRIRKLEAGFDVRFTRVEDPGELPEAFAALLDLHHRRWAPRGGSDGLHTPELIAFHRDFSRLALERGWLRLYLLHVGGRPAAAIYGFRYRDRFLHYQGGFDPAHAHLGVGLVSMAFAIREAIAEGAREFDFLHGEEPYKFLWARDVRELMRLELYPPSPAGRLRFELRRAARGAKSRIKRWLGREPRPAAGAR